MAGRKKNQKEKNNNGANLGFEQKLWQTADKLRGNMDASDYKHVVLGLIFLKYISDAFEEKREQLLFGFSDPKKVTRNSKIMRSIGLICTSSSSLSAKFSK